jgi:hypothetical protein
MYNRELNSSVLYRTTRVPHYRQKPINLDICDFGKSIRGGTKFICCKGVNPHFKYPPPRGEVSVRTWVCYDS